ncbi:hypothetical protein [Alkalinema sp. FACHB-956]|uniref:hypothetical protein n=1 Tax=Alkalinema sp. FACHB-956 TaxID=2692768 RepID=UPI0016890D5F|nr:hypothetical protein [Alkalinema sp. FACHB-956]MBD2327515.1 hypothetical protein [Alkalinema sp. FACHB-956]
MNYLVAVVRDRKLAEAADAALQAGKVPTTNRAILGQGHKTADDFGLANPRAQAWNRVKWSALWMVPFGFVGGIGFNLSTQLNTFPWAGEVGNVILGGLLGAFGGFTGSLFMGSSAGLFSKTGDALPYRSQMDAGKYLVIVKGSEVLVQRALMILKQESTESLQIHTDKTGTAYLR